VERSSDGSTANLALSLDGQGRHTDAKPLIEQALQANSFLKRRPFFTETLEKALRAAR